MSLKFAEIYSNFKKNILYPGLHSNVFNLRFFFRISSSFVRNNFDILIFFQIFFKFFKFSSKFKKFSSRSALNFLNNFPTKFPKAFNRNLKILFINLVFNFPKMAYTYLYFRKFLSNLKISLFFLFWNFPQFLRNLLNLFLKFSSKITKFATQFP